MTTPYQQRNKEIVSDVIRGAGKGYRTLMGWNWGSPIAPILTHGALAGVLGYYGSGKAAKLFIDRLASVNPSAAQAAAKNLRDPRRYKTMQQRVGLLAALLGAAVPGTFAYSQWMNKKSNYDPILSSPGLERPFWESPSIPIMQTKATIEANPHMSAYEKTIAKSVIDQAAYGKRMGLISPGQVVKSVVTGGGLSAAGAVLGAALGLPNAERNILTRSLFAGGALGNLLMAPR